MANFFDQFDDSQKTENFFDRFDAPAEEEVKQPVKDAGFSLGDLAKSFGVGATGSTKALTDVAGADNVVSAALGKGVEKIQQSMTPERRAEMERQAARMKAAEESGSLLEEVKAGALNVAEAPLQSAAQAIGSFVPYLLSTPVGIGMRLTGASKLAIEAVAKQAPKVIGTAQGAGAVKSSIYDGVLQAEMEAGVDPELAKQKAEAAQSYFGGNIEQILLGAGLGLAAGSKGVEEFFSKAGRAGAPQGIGRRVAESVLKESVPEAAQGGQEQLAQNIALQREGYDVDTFKGVAGAATQEALTGALGAAPIAAMVRPETKTPESVDAFKKEEEEFRKQFGTTEPVEAPAAEAPEVEPPVELPGGYSVARREVSRKEVPESFDIFAEGSDKPLTTVATQDEVDRKIQTLTEIRKEEQARLLEESDKITKSIQDEQRKLDVMEATGQTDTDLYVQSKALLEQKQDEAAQQIKDLNDKIVSYGSPLSFAPVGARLEVENEFVVNRGDEAIGVFPSMQAAETSLRERDPEVFKQADIEAETQAAAARAKQLEETLKPMLAKFNLGDVGLNIVDRLQNNAGGAYLDRLIQVSMEEANPIQTMRHESLHALKDLEFFTPQQWNALKERAEKQWIKEYLEDQTAELEVDGKPVKMSRLDAYKQIGLTQEDIIEEAIADAFGAYDRGETPPPGMIAALFKKLKNFFMNFGQALRGAGFESAEDVFQRVERGELKSRKPAKKAKPEEAAQKEAKKPTPEKQPEEAAKEEEAAGKFSIKPNTWKADKADIKQAEEYFEENGILPYTSEGQLDVPVQVDGTKYSIKSAYTEAQGVERVKKRRDGTQVVVPAKFNDPITGLPMNADGTVTLYYPTTNEIARKIATAKKLTAHSPTANRIYLTNESSANAVAEMPGMIDQPLGGANVMFKVDPSMVELAQIHDSGRRDFFIPIAEGEYFAKKMKMTKLFTVNAPRSKGLHPDRSLAQVTEGIEKAAEAWKNASAKERAQMFNDAKNVLNQEHNIGTLFGANAKLEKTNIGEYGLTYKGKKVMSTGLGFASAQKISDQRMESTCPKSAICEALCLGETSGQNELYGGEGPFRSGPRLSQFLKTEAFVVNPEAFATSLIRQIERFRNEAKKLGYQPAIRLNVTSDFPAKMFRPVIEMFPDVMFYDYTKLETKTIADNHHLTYSSTGASQVLNPGKPNEQVIFNKESNWDRVVEKILTNGKNVAMAFTSRNDMPKFVLDERTGKTFEVWNGDEYDARFLDPVRPDGDGWIIGLTNKDRTTAPEDAAKKHNGFFLDYDKERDGETLVIRNQAELAKGRPQPVEFKVKEKFSLRTPISPAFKQWFGDSKIVDGEGKPKVMYHGLAKDTTDFSRKTERGAPIFLTDDPKFADRFATDSYLQVADHPEKYLTKAQLAEGEKRAISFIRKDYGKDTLGKEMIASIRDGSPTVEAREYLQKEYVTMLPTGPHVMPLYVRAERPFDYENPSHIRKVLAELGEGSYDPAEIRSGSWESIEGADFQEAIQMAGFDSFYVKEHGRKNLAVYQPNQVKSATGNVGTFSRESNDVRYSLKNVAFPSAEEASKAVAATSVPKTEEFKRFIAGNQWVDEDGEQKAFYHGTASEFFEFTPAGKASAIYLADTPEEAEAFGKIAEDRLRQQVYRALTKDEKVDFFQSIVDAKVESGSMSEKDGADFMRQVKRKAPEFDKFGDLQRETRAALIDLSPTRTAIMPLYARAETPFDFRNPEHVAQVVKAVKRPDAKLSEEAKQEAKEMGVPTEYPDHWYRGLPGRLKQGFTTSMEDEPVQTAIRRLGFDGYVSRRNRTSPLVYAVYTPEQVKSVTGNIGEFDRESKDMRYSLKKVRYSDGRFEKLWNESMYTQSDAEKKTKGYLAFVNPMDFVRATVSTDYYDRLLQEREPLDLERLKAYDQVPFLSVSEKNGEWKITGHEGRHRMMALHDDGYREVPVYIHLRAEDAESIPVKALTAQYADAVSSVLMIAEVEPLSYVNKQKAMEKFTRMSSKVKYSLPNIPANINDRIGETTFKREEKGFVERMIEAISPQSASSFRQRYLNRYNQMSVYDKALADKMGGAALLADQSAESAALMSDLGAGIAASAMGMGDRNGGIPVLRNGITTIDTKVKGLIASLAPLAAYGDPSVYQRYQYWAMVKRGQRLNKEGKLTGIDSSDVAFAKFLEQKHPEFVSVQKDLITFNNGVVQYMVDTGVLSKERAKEYTKHADYIPFYRQMDGDNTLGPNLFQSLSGVKPPKKLKGKDVAEAPLADFLETMVRNTQSAIQAGIKNYAAQRAINVASQVKAPGMGVQRLNTASTAPNVINVLEKGQLVSYQTPDPLLIDAMKSLNLSELPFMGILSAPADLLRNLVTKDPGFMMANLMRDSLSAWVTSGQKMTPIAGTVINFGKALTRNSPGFEAMQNAGIIGGYEFSANIEQSGFKLEKDLAEKAGKKAPIALRPFKSVWDALEKGTTASDAATRALIYERVLKDTGNEAEALYRSLEVMNFHRKGNSPLIRVLTAAVPFFNARLQGLDLFYRASTGNMNNKDAAAIQRQFWARGMTMMALSCAYWFMVSDDEEYKKQEQETKDNNWLIPSLGIRIPIPFEVGVLFKVIPERIAAYTFGDDTGKDLKDALYRNAMSTFAFNPIPQTVKPIVETAFNFNTFTWRPIVGKGLESAAPEYQVGPSTSNVAKQIGQALGLSPMKVDHVIKGYTGTIGMYGVDTIDMVLDQFNNSPKPTKRFEQLPVIKRFALDKEARGNVTQYYELKDAVDTTVRTMNLLEKTGESEEYVKYLKANIGTLAFKDYINDTEKTMKDLRDMRNAVRSSQMSGDEKRDALLEISKAESAITSQIQLIKKSIASIQ